MPNTKEKGKLIEVLSKHIPYGYATLCLIAEELIAEGVTVQEWISVKDRLPEPGVRVLASDEEFVGEFYINKRGQWQRYNVNDVALLMALDVLWWKPLPRPPKGE